MALMARAYNQAQKFGAEMAIPDEATRLVADVIFLLAFFLFGSRGQWLRDPENSSDAKKSLISRFANAPFAAAEQSSSSKVSIG